MSQPIVIPPDQYNLMLAENAKAAFIDQGFINTMRFSELNGDEEYDNTFLYAIWHGYLETGLQQLSEYVEWILRELAISAYPEDPKSQLPSFVSRLDKPSLAITDVAVLLDKTVDRIPYDQKQRIYRFFVDLSRVLEGYSTLKTIPPPEDGTRFLSANNETVEVDTFHHYMIGLMRRYLMQYNQNLVWFVAFYDSHIAILNGRMARARGHKKELLQLAQTVLERKPGLTIGEPAEKKHWWSR